MQTMREQVKKAVGMPEPKFPTMVLARERNVTLSQFLEHGVKVPAAWGGSKVTVLFTQEGEPFCARRDTGWLAVRVVERVTGAPSVLLYEAHDGQRVSGMVRLKRR